MNFDPTANWLAFLGAWLLVAGPLYQGALEMLEEEVDREGFQAVVEGADPLVTPSAWWWLLPPVMVALRRHHNEALRRQVRERLSPEQLAQFTRLRHKATGWFVVAAGASLIAVKETWTLSKQLDLPGWAFVCAIVAMAALAVSNTVLMVLAHRQER